MSERDEPQCTGPFSDAFDCPVHDPRKRKPGPTLPPPSGTAEARIAERITPLSRALRRIAQSNRLSSTSVPVLEDAADELDGLTADLARLTAETLSFRKELKAQDVEHDRLTREVVQAEATCAALVAALEHAASSGGFSLRPIRDTQLGGGGMDTESVQYRAGKRFLFFSVPTQHVYLESIVELIAALGHPTPAPTDPQE